MRNIFSSSIHISFTLLIVLLFLQYSISALPTFVPSQLPTFQPTTHQPTSSPTIGFPLDEQVALATLQKLLNESGAQLNWKLPCSSNWVGLSVDDSSGICHVKSLTISGSLFRNIRHNLPIDQIINAAFSFQKLEILTLLDLFQGVIPSFPPTALSELTQLVIHNNSNLNSTIPTSIGNLKGLQNLTMDYNFLQGTIPSEVALLSTLTYLELQYNCISGSIPTELGRLTGLTLLSLEKNRLMSQIPTWLGNLAAVTFFDVSKNSLSGTIPWELSNLSKLQKLFLDGNEINGSIPHKLGNIRSLLWLNISSTHVSGAIPDLSELVNMTNLYLNCNKITGNLPNWLGNLSRLEFLDVWDTSISGPIPDLGRLSRLIRLKLSKNALTSTIPTQLGKLGSLTGLYLDGNSLSGDIPDELSNIIKLKELLLDNNKLKGPIPNMFYKMKSLLKLHFQNNLLNGQLPRSMMELQKLQLLYLWDNRLNGTLNASNLVSLQQLKVQQNFFSGSLPQFGSSSQIKEVSVFCNLLSGTIPTLTHLSNLHFYDMGSNSLSGTIPPSLFHMKNLERLDISNNSLSGSIPSEVGDFHNVSYLLLGKNSLRGTIPSQLATLTKLEVLDIRSCMLSGTLPSELGKLTSLKVLNASGNSLVGTLPSELGNLRKLVQLSLQQNFLTGKIPESLSNLDSLELMYLGYNQLGGRVRFFENGSFPSLVYLDVTQNRLTGPLVMTSVPQKLKFLSVAFNCLSGSIDISLLCSALPLETIILDAATSNLNCIPPENFFWGTDRGARVKHGFDSIFGDEVHLQFNSYRALRLDGTLPGCLFHSLPSISTIRLGGLGLKGSLPDSHESWGNQLIDITIDDNELTGTIPAAMHRASANLQRLDLSYNWFKGSLDGLMLPKNSENCVFLLRRNRFSGYIPASLLGSCKPKMRVLEGNLFDCDEEHTLPQDDKRSSTYSCGSQHFDHALYASLAALGFTVLFIAYQMSRGRFYKLGIVVTRRLCPGSSSSSSSVLSLLSGFQSNIDEAAEKENALLKEKVPHVEAFIVLLSEFCSICVFIGCISTLVLMTVYPLLKFAVDDGEYSMYTKQYAWAPSAMFMTGVVPAALLVGMWSCYLITTKILFYRSFHMRLSEERAANLRRSANELLEKSVEWENVHRQSRRDWSMAAKASSVDSRSLSERPLSLRLADSLSAPFVASASRCAELYSWTVTLRLCLRLFLIVVINCSISLIINIGYMRYYYFEKFDTTQQSLLQLGVAVIKLWLRHLASILRKSRILRLGLSEEEIEAAPSYLKAGVGVELVLTIFNIILAPLMVTSAAEKSCYYDIIRGSNFQSVMMNRTVLALKNEEILSTNFTMTSSVSLDRTTSESLFLQELVTPFSYSYECSSSLIRVYAPPLLMCGVIKTFFFPFAAYVGRWALDFCYRLREKRLASVFPATVSNESQSPLPQPRPQSEMGEEEGEKIRALSAVAVTTGDPSILDRQTSSSLEDSAWQSGKTQLLDAVIMGLTFITPHLLRTTAERSRSERHKITENRSCRTYVESCIQLCKWPFFNDSTREIYHFLNSRTIILDTIIDLLVLLTFGVVCPLLGLVYICAIYCRCTRWMYMAATFVSKNDAATCALLNLDCARAWKKQKNLIFRLRWLIIMFPSFFLSFFVWDIAASAEGVGDSSWAPITMFLLPSIVSLVLNHVFPSLVQPLHHTPKHRSIDFLTSLRIRLRTLSSFGTEGISMVNLASNPVTGKRSSVGISVDRDDVSSENLSPEPSRAVGRSVDEDSQMPRNNRIPSLAPFPLAQAATEELFDAIPLPAEPV